MIGANDADLRVLLPAPGLGPVLPQLHQPVHNLAHLVVVVVRGRVHILQKCNETDGLAD